MTAETIVRETTTRVVAQISMSLGTRNLSLDNIVLITISLMTLVESAKALSGDQKKSIVASSLKDFAISNLEEPTRTDVCKFIDIVLPGLMDEIISLDKGKTKIAIDTVKECCVML